MAINDHRVRPADGDAGDRDLLWSDSDLVDACLAGRQFAWDALITRYRTLVYSVIVKSGGASGEEDDVFQAVWLDVYNQLGELVAAGEASVSR